MTLVIFLKDFVFENEKKSAAVDKRSMQNYPGCIDLRQDQYIHVLRKKTSGNLNGVHQIFI